MKTFAALLLLSAITAYVSASELAFHPAVIDFLDQQHNEQLAEHLRDQGLPEADTLVASDSTEKPEYMKRCDSKGKICLRQAYDDCKKFACIEKYDKCIKESRPTPLPTLSPLQKFCMKVLPLCVEANSSCAGKLHCIKRIKECFDLNDVKPTTRPA